MSPGELWIKFEHSGTFDRDALKTLIRATGVFGELAEDPHRFALNVWRSTCPWGLRKLERGMVTVQFRGTRATSLGVRRGHPGSMMRRVTAGAMVMVLLSVLASCSIPVVGRVGIGRDDQGVLRVYVRSCEQTMRTAVLAVVDEGSTANTAPDSFAAWEIKHVSRSLKIDWPLEGPGDDRVVATKRLTEPLTSTKHVEITAWSGRSNYRSDGPWDFTLSELVPVKSGNVLTIDQTGASQGNVVMRFDDFNKIDCAQFG